MNTLMRKLWKCAGILSILALLAPSLAIAKPLDADTVRARIAKRRS